MWNSDLEVLRFLKLSDPKFGLHWVVSDDAVCIKFGKFDF